MLNPFTMVYDALAEMPLRHPVFRDLVKEGNFILFRDGRDPLKGQVLDADLPEVLLVSDTANLNVHETSHTSRITRQYSWVMTTGDMRLHERLYLLEWALFCAMSGWQSALRGLVWPDGSGWHFCKRFDATGVTSGQADTERRPGIRGWAAAWRCEIEMHFQTSDLIRELNQ